MAVLRTKGCQCAGRVSTAFFYTLPILIVPPRFDPPKTWSPAITTPFRIGGPTQVLHSQCSELHGPEPVQHLSKSLVLLLHYCRMKNNFPAPYSNSAGQGFGQGLLPRRLHTICRLWRTSSAEHRTGLFFNGDAGAPT